MLGLPPWVPTSLGALILGAMLVWGFVTAARGNKQRRAAWGDALNATLAEYEARGERALLKATPCHIRKGFMTRPSVRAALTSARVLCKWGGSEEIALKNVREVSEATSYNGEYRYGITWVVFECKDRELALGFLTGEHTRWLEALRPLVAGAQG